MCVPCNVQMRTDLDIKDALKRKDGPWILQMLRALMDLMNTVTHCTVEKFELNTKEGDQSVKKDAFKIVIYSPSGCKPCL